MGATVQECMPQQCLQKLHTIQERKRTLLSHDHNLPSNIIMGRRQSQRRSPLPHNTPPRQDNNHFTEKLRPQQRRKNKTNIPSSGKCASQVQISSDQGTPAAPSVGGRGEAQRPPSRHRARSSHIPCRLSDSSSPDLTPPRSTGPKQGTPGKSSEDPGKDTDSDRDLSDTERLPASPAASSSTTVPPQLDLRPEVIAPDDLSPDTRGRRGRGGPWTTSSSYPFPDFLPPPFNTWSLAQLASFYHTESRRTLRPRPSDPLERFLERLLQLEWQRMQTAARQEETEGEGQGEVGGACEAPARCCRSHSASSARLAVRLSCPKSILQCQRAFPLTFLSSLAIDSALLSGCGCSQCRQRYAAQAAFSSSFSSSGGGGATRLRRCPSAHCPRPSPLAEHAHPGAPPSLPKRSHSETRAWAPVERGATPARARTQTRGRPPLSPARGNNNNNNSHLRRMRALGNLRNPGPPAETPPPPPPGGDRPDASAPLRDSRVPGSGAGHRSSAGWRNRSCSANRGGRGGGGGGVGGAGGGGGGGGVQRGAERYEKRRSESECRRGVYERRRATALGGHDIKPDAGAEITDSLPPTPSSMNAEATRVLESLTEVEEAAEDVLTTKQQIVNLDSKRNNNREALRALRSTPDSEKAKVCFGNMFIKLPKSKTQDMIQRDQEQLDKEISNLRQELKAKLNHLNKLQGGLVRSLGGG
ncbi:hypothetical protein CRUP_031922 [Coryphaenoides rupestris]|nr:hypothetical protein CRUP_031922 [Coryphaenoides rupestris]